LFARDLAAGILPPWWARRVVTVDHSAATGGESLHLLGWHWLRRSSGLRQAHSPEWPACPHAVDGRWGPPL